MRQHWSSLRVLKILLRPAFAEFKVLFTHFSSLDSRRGFDSTVSTTVGMESLQLAQTAVTILMQYQYHQYQYQYQRGFLGTQLRSDM